MQGAAILDYPVLVLNRNFQAIWRTVVRVAIADVYCGKAEAVAPLGDNLYQNHTWHEWKSRVPHTADVVIRTAHSVYVAPRVIRLLDYDRLPIHPLACTRRSVYERDRHTCQYCGTQPGSALMTVDHVLPRSRGGKFTWENIVAACKSCNQRKGDRTPSEAWMPLRQKPIRPKWQPLSAGDFILQVYGKQPPD